MSAEDAWNAWERLLEPRDDDSEAEGLEIELRRAEAELDLDETVAYENEDNEDNMAAAQVDIAALLAQLTQANIDQTQRNIDIDARAVNAAQARGREDTIRAQVSRIDKCEGDDKPKLRRWVRDLNTLHVAHPGVVVEVAERTSRGNLSDTIEEVLRSELFGRKHTNQPGITAKSTSGQPSPPIPNLGTGSRTKRS